jgi:hypothetical protein
LHNGRSGSFGLSAARNFVEKARQAVADPLHGLRRLGLSYLFVQNGNVFGDLMGQFWIDDSARFGFSIPQHLLEFADQFGAFRVTDRLRRLSPLGGFVTSFRGPLDFRRSGWRLFLGVGCLLLPFAPNNL